nr:MAG TPA: hypothetical protein [Caudoviricetes sp.]
MIVSFFASAMSFRLNGVSYVFIGSETKVRCFGTLCKFFVCFDFLFAESK